MKKCFLLLLATAISASAAYSQQSAIRMSGKYDKDNKLFITLDKVSYGVSTVVINFEYIENSTLENPLIKQISTTDSFEVPRTNENQPAKYRGARIWWLDGPANTKVKKDFVYRLPIATDKPCRVSDLYNINERYFGEEESGFKSYMFYMEKGDTVYAARKGIVTKIENGHDPVNDGSKVSFTTHNNYIKVQHPDGTIGSYNVLAKDSFMIEEGDIVYPGTPIALAGSYDSNTYQSRFMVYYYTHDRSRRFNPDKGMKSIIDTHYVTPMFATRDGITAMEHNKTYTPVMDEEMLTREMSKKEKKNHGNIKK